MRPTRRLTLAAVTVASLAVLPSCADDDEQVDLEVPGTVGRPDDDPESVPDPEYHETPDSAAVTSVPEADDGEVDVGPPVLDEGSPANEETPGVGAGGGGATGEGP